MIVWEHSENYEGIDAAACDKELHRIAAKSPDRGFTTDQVVAAARDPASPLHKIFTWDDTEAAEAFRRVEADRMLNNLIDRYSPTPESAPRTVSNRMQF